MSMRSTAMGNLPRMYKCMGAIQWGRFFGQKIVLPSVKKTFEIVGDSSCKIVKL